MQLSKFTDYSIRVLIYLGTLEKGEITRISDVSEIYKISKNHLVKVIYNLGQLGYIETIRGKNGGFKLNANPAEIRIGEAIRLLEPLKLLNCSPKACNISPACRLSQYLIDAKERFLEELDKYTVEDLLTNNAELPIIFNTRRKACNLLTAEEELA